VDFKTDPNNCGACGNVDKYCGSKPDASCDNVGVQFAAYTQSPAQPVYENSYKNFNPTVFDTQIPQLTGTTTGVSFDVEGWSPEVTSVYGSAETIEHFYLALNHQGYLYAPLTGTYTFRTQAADNIFLLWIGPLAKTGWNRANADLEGTVGNPNQILSLDLVKGEYYAMRFLWGNGSGPGVFAFSITAPDGSVLLDRDTVASPFIVQYSCDVTSAPPFPSWP
jgi:hypothetical protein